MNHAPGVRSIIKPVDMQSSKLPLYYDNPLSALSPGQVSDEYYILVYSYCLYFASLPHTCLMSLAPNTRTSVHWVTSNYQNSEAQATWQGPYSPPTYLLTAPRPWYWRWVLLMAGVVLGPWYHCRHHWIHYRWIAASVPSWNPCPLDQGTSYPGGVALMGIRTSLSGAQTAACSVKEKQQTI